MIDSTLRHSLTSLFDLAFCRAFAKLKFSLRPDLSQKLKWFCWNFLGSASAICKVSSTVC